MPIDAPTPAADAEAVVVESTGAGRFQVQAQAGGATLLIDEPAALGGLGSGPGPFDLLSAALGSCTVMTMRLYAQRKGWPLTQARARVSHHRGTLQARDTFSLEIELEGDLDTAQRERLMEIAGHCPVHLTLNRGADVATTLLPAGQAVATQAPDPPAPRADHMKTMEEACDEPT